ncbi:MAG: transcriptional repressor [Spirochaetia bacterium]|nr:transcriptional repressor [Spirochaetia bacterium]
MTRYSRQRELILKTVQTNLIHPTADEVYALVHAQDPTISLGTVYRNLNLLSQSGAIRKVAVPGGADRFDGNTTPHHHIICTFCGMAADYSYDFGKLKDDVLHQTGIECSHLTVTLEGICRNCREKLGGKNG